MDGDGLLLLEVVLGLLVFIAIGLEILTRHRRTRGVSNLGVKRGYCWRTPGLQFSRPWEWGFVVEK
jgi:hypothetical protein